jgi:hypothetical protein
MQTQKLVQIVLQVRMQNCKVSPLIESVIVSKDIFGRYPETPLVQKVREFLRLTSENIKTGF